MTLTPTPTLALSPALALALALNLTRYNVVALEPDEAMADEKDMDGVDIVELTPSAAWRP